MFILERNRLSMQAFSLTHHSLYLPTAEPTELLDSHYLCEAVASEGDDVDDVESQPEEQVLQSWDLRHAGMCHSCLRRKMKLRTRTEAMLAVAIVKSSQCQDGKASDARYAIQRKKRQRANRAENV